MVFFSVDFFMDNLFYHFIIRFVIQYTKSRLEKVLNM